MVRFKHFLALISLNACICTGAFSAGPKTGYDFVPAQPAMLSITARESLHHVQVLASAPFEGRRTGTPGQWLAAKYIANEFRAYGLKPAPGSKTFYQPFSIVRSQTTWTARLTSTTRNGHTLLRHQMDFITLELSGAGEVRAEAVFTGYGITMPEYNYDDYAQINVRGKIAIVLRHEPEFITDHYGEAREKHKFTLLSKLMNARKHGAVGLILIEAPGSTEKTRPPDFPRANRATGWHGSTDSALIDFPAMWVRKAAVSKLLQSQSKFVLAAKEAIDRKLGPRSFEVEDLVLAMKVGKPGDVFDTQNVVAFVEGYGARLKQEVVVVGAHYDHLGKKHGKIYPGADDNASGTAALLEIAQAFGQSGIRTRRSLLFVAFAGEELGLLGSQFYVNHPSIPLRQTVTMINLDMIGRNAADELTVIGSNRSPELRRINQAANREIGFALRTNGERYFDRSDQMYFARNKIPVIFYYGGDHLDYHLSSDTADKVNGRKIARVARLAFLVTWMIAELDSRPSFHPFESRR